MTAQVSGDRICRHCEGLVHNGLREKNGKRKAYFCSEYCLYHYIRDEDGYPREKEQINKIISNHYEKVIVKSK